MKNNILLVGLLTVALASCKKENSGGINGTPGGTGAPTITRVRTVSKSVVDSSRTTTLTTYDSTGKAIVTTNPNYNPQITGYDSTTATGKIGNYYAIIGSNLGSTKTIAINGVSIYFNRALNSDNTVIFNIPNTVPFEQPQSNTIVLTTLHGSVTYKFTILQPPPQINSFGPVAGAVGDTVTITGTALEGALSVKFGTVPAKIVANTSSQIKVLIPAGVVQAFLFVTTVGGTTESTASFGFKYLIYDDALHVGWGGNGGGYSGYSSNLNFTNTTHVKRGTSSIEVDFTSNYGALQIGYGGSPAISVSALGLTAIKFSVYGGNGVKTGDKLQVVINGNYNGTTVTMTAGAYTDFTIPLSTLGNPLNISEFVLQAQGTAVPSTIYVDDIGFI